MQVIDKARDPTGAADEALLIAEARTDRESLGRLYDRYALRVYRYAYRRLSSHEDAEDVTAQTFRRAIEGLHGFTWQGAPFGAWLFRIAHNLIVDRYRAGAAVSLDGHGHGQEIPDPLAVDPENALLAREEAGEVWTAVAALPALQSRAVVLRFGRGLSHAEVGAIIGRSETATKQLIYRAVKTLRARLRVSPGCGAAQEEGEE